jgi:hypothetical protein
LTRNKPTSEGVVMNITTSPQGNTATDVACVQLLSTDTDYELARRIIERKLAIWGIDKESDMHLAFMNSVTEACQNAIRWGCIRWNDDLDKIPDPNAVWSLTLCKNGNCLTGIVHDSGQGFVISRIKAHYTQLGIRSKGIAQMLELSDVDVCTEDGCTVTIKVSPGGAAH